MRETFGVSRRFGLTPGMAVLKADVGLATMIHGARRETNATNVSRQGLLLVGQSVHLHTDAAVRIVSTELRVMIFISQPFRC
mmetsp:Transcript_24211/g.34029  ORF Transcript_24211/g.34029 Transcript_24211/m.34029 type:complete len:82 (+) Transcript_24211:183-428(+)